MYSIKKLQPIFILLGLLIAVLSLPTFSTTVVNKTVQTQVVGDFNKQVMCMAKNIYHESAKEKYEGKLAVAQVTMNRVNDPDFPKDVCDVVYQKTKYNQKTTCQFSWTCIKGLKVNDVYAWEESVLIARRALTETVLHDTIAKTRALYYHANYVNPGWNKKYVVSRIGNHIFYRDI
jgi:spore germination cell wall hydrolase CwlJ-like protein